MFKKTMVAICLSVAFLITPISALAATNPLQRACNVGNGQAAQSAICSQAGSINNNSDNPVATTLHTASDIIALIVAVIAVIMIIISGLTFVTSRGDANAVATSRNRIIYAVVGLLIIAMAWTITTLLVDHI